MIARRSSVTSKKRVVINNLSMIKRNSLSSPSTTLPRLRRTGPRAGTASETFRGKEQKRRACPSSPARALLRKSMSCDAPPSLSLVCLPAGGPHTSTRRSLYSSPSPFSTDFSLMHMHMHIMPSQPACGPKKHPTRAPTHARARARTHSRTHIRASPHFNLTALTPVLPRSGWQ